MAYRRPGLSELYQQFYTDLGRSRFRVSFNSVLAKAFAGTAHMLHGHIAYISRNLLPDSAEGTYLERWAAVWNIHRKPAGKARGKVVLRSTVSVMVSAGTLFKARKGTAYALRTQVMVDGQTEAEIESVAPGEASNILADEITSEVLTIEMTVPGLESTAAISGEIVGGVDEEKDGPMRERLLERIQHPPQGGALHDYVLWSKEVPGITRAWILPHPGTGRVEVAFVKDGQDNIIPTQMDLDRLNTRLVRLAPAGAKCIVNPPIPVVKKLKILLVPSDKNELIKTKVKSALRSLYIREAAPRGYLDINRNQVEGTIPVSHISQAISSVEGEKYHKIYDEHGVPLTANLSVASDGQILIYTDPEFITTEPSGENS